MRFYKDRSLRIQLVLSQKTMISLENKKLSEHTLRQQKDALWSYESKNVFVNEVFFLVDLEHSHSFFSQCGRYRDCFAFMRSSEMRSVFTLTTQSTRMWFPLRTQNLKNHLWWHSENDQIMEIVYPEGILYPRVYFCDQNSGFEVQIPTGREIPNARIHIPA